MAGGKQWEGGGWIRAEWHRYNKLLELGPEVAGQFHVVFLTDKTKRDRV